MPIDPFFGSMAASGISALANLGGGMMSAGGAAAANAQQQAQFQQGVRNQQDQYDRTNELNAWYFQKNFENQQYMSNTAYQRATADMKAAGLNPILAYQQGGANASAGGMQSGASGASSPSAQPTHNVGAEMGRGLSRAVNSGLDAARTYADVQNVVSTNDLIKQQTAKTSADTNLSNANAIKAAADTDLTREDIKNRPYLQELLKGQTSAATAAAGLSGASAAAVGQDARRKEQFGDSWIGGMMNTGQQILNRVAPQIRDLSAATKSPTPNPGQGSDFWGTSPSILERARINRERYSK